MNSNLKKLKMERNRHFIDDISSLGEDVTIFTKDNAKKPVDGEEEGIAVIQELPEAEPVDENELDPLQMKKTEEDNKVICGYRLHDAFIGSLTPIEFAEVVAMFMRFDVNNDRLIDKFEARKILFIQDLDASLSKAEELMAIMNISGNRDVGFDEFCRFIVMIKNGDQTVVKFRRLLNQINSSTLGRLEQQAKLRNLELKFSICDDLRERKSTQPIRFMELQITGMWYKIVDGERQSRFEVKSFLQSGPTLYDAKVATAKAALSYFEQIMPGMKCQPGELPDEWMTWVDENLERGVDPVNIVSILAGKGFHPHRNIALMQRIVTWESFTKFLVKYPDLEFSAATMHVPFQVWAKDLASKGVDGEIILKVVQDRGFDLLRDQVHFAQQLRMNQLGSLVERDGRAPQLLDFWLACERGFDEEVMIFCTCLMPVNEEKLGRHTSEPQRPLSLAAMGNHVRVLEILIAHGADVRAVDRRGRTALHLAARSGHRDACAVLVDNKAMMFARDHQGNTPMHLAAIANHPTVVDYFAFKGREFVGIITSNKIRCKEGYTFQSLVHEVFETIQSAKLSSYELRRMEKRWLEEASHMFRELMDPEIRYMLAPANTQVANDILKRFDPRPETGVYITRGALLQQEYVPNIASSHDLAVMLDYIFRQSSLDTQNRMKRTPLHCACDENVLASHEAVIKLLIDFHGCNVHMIDMHGRLAMELLMVDKRTSIVPSATRVREEYIRDVRERELDFITARNDAEDRLETIRRRREIMAECTYRSEHMSSTLWNIVREASLRVKTYDHGHWEIYEDPDTGNYFYCNPPSSEGSAEGEEDKYTNLTWNIPKELVLISNRAIALEYLIKMMSVFQRKLGRWEVYRSKATDLIFYYDSDLDVLRYSMPPEGKWVDLLRLSTPVERLGYGCEWEVRQDKTGNCFYRNVYNMECYWDQPSDAVRIDPRERLCSAFQYRNRSTVQRWFSCEQCNRGWRIAGKPGRTILRICEGCINRCHKGHKGIRFVKESLVLCCCEQICKAVGCICLGRHLSERQQTVQREAFDGRNEIKRKAEHDRCMPPIFCPVPPVWPDGSVKKESGWRLCRRVPLNGQTLLNFGEVRANHEDTDDDEDDYHPEPQTDVLLLENGETSDGKEIESTVNQLMRMVDTEADVDIEAEDDTLPLASPLAKTDGKKRRGSLRKILLKELENEFEYTPPPGLPEGWIQVVDLEQPAVISVGSRVLAHCRYSPPRYYGYITAVHRRGKRGLIYSIKVDNIPVEEHLPRTHIEVISNPSFFCNIELGLSAWTIEQANTAPFPSSPLGMCGNEWLRVLDRAAFRRTFGPIDEMHHIFCNFLFYQEPEALAREKAVLRIQRFLRKRRFLPLTSIPWMTSAFTMSVPAEVTRQKKELAAWAYLRRRSECIGEFFDLEKMEWEELIDKKGLELFYWLEATNTYSWDKPPYPDEGNQTNVDYFAVGQDVTYTIPGKGEELMTVVKVRFDDETGEDMYDIAQKFHGDGTVYRWLSRIQLKSIPLEGEEFYLKKSEMKWKETLKRHREAMERKQKRDQERLIAEELARYNETLVAERRMESGYNKDNIARRTRAKMMRLLQEVRDVEKENEQTVGAQRKKAVMAAIEELKNTSTTRLSRADVLRLNRQLDLKLRMDEKIEQSKLVRKELLRKKKIAADRCKFTEDHLREKEAPVTTPRSLVRRRVIRNVHVAMRRQEDGWVICQWGCGDWVKKGFQQADHEKNLCPKRIIGCTQGCEEKHMEEVWLKLHNQEEEVVNELALLQQKANSAGINTKAALEGMTYQQWHEENECIKRLVDCPNRCLEFVPFDQLQRHLEELCTKRPAQPLECRLGCGQKFGGLVEELVKAEDDRLLHEQEQCENRLVRCNWKFEDGTLCASQMPAKERHLHRDYHITLMGTKTYLIPGTYLYKVPRGVPRLKVQVWGAGGGSGYFYNRVTGSGGGGAFVEAILNVQSYEVLEIVVGSGGGAGVTGTELEVADIENHRKLHASMDLRARTVSMLAGRPAPKPEDQNLNVDVIDSTCGVALGGTPGGGEGYGGGGCWATGGGGGYSIVSSRTARGSQALLVASGGGGGASNNGLPGGGMDGPLKGTLIDPRNGATATAEAGGAAGESGSMYNTKWPATNGQIWQGGNGSEFGAGGGGGYYGGGGGGTVPGVGGGGGGGSSYVYTPRVLDYVIVLGHGHMCGGLEHKPPQAAGIGDWDLTGGFVGQGGIGELTKTNRGNNGCVRIIKPGHY